MLKKCFVSMAVVAAMLLVNFQVAMCEPISPIIESSSAIQMMPNPGFESVKESDGLPTNWTFYNTSASLVYSIESITDESGSNNILKVVDTSTTSTGTMFTDTIFPQPDYINEDFTISFRYKTSGATAGSSTTVIIAATDKAGVNVFADSQYTLLTVANTATDWTVASKTFNFSDTGIFKYATGKSANDVARITLRLYNSLTKSHVGTFYYDDFSFTHTGSRTINPPVVKDSNDTVIDSLNESNAGNNITATVNVVDSICENYPITVVTALYDKNNKLITVGIADNSNKLQGNNDITATLSIPSGAIDGKYVKVMTLSSWQNIEPIFPVRLIPEDLN